MHPHLWSPHALAHDIRTRRTTAEQVMTTSRERIEERDAELAAFVHLDWSAAQAAAVAVDERVAAGEDPGPLAGVPFGVKDTEDCAGMPTRFGSLLLQDAHPAAKDAVHVGRMPAAGAIPIGKTATPEFASGLITVTRRAVTRNPWNPVVTPGGSSGGSAAAVAAGMVAFATGSDAGGSLRIPASLCGLVGMKTSFDAIPLAAREPSYTNCVGALTGTVADTARLLDVMIGGDSDLAASLGHHPLQGMGLAYLPRLGGAGATDEVAAACEHAVEVLVADSGLERRDPSTYALLEDPNQTFVTVCAADAWSMLDVDAALDRHADLLTDYSRKRFQRARELHVDDLGRAHAARMKIRRRFAAWFSDTDVFCFPTMSTCDVPAAGPAPTRLPGQELEGPAAACPLTRIANLIGAPSASVPVGVASNGVPIGLQVMTAPGTDSLALTVAQRLEQLLPTALMPSITATATTRKVTPA
jgi:aspartyl-tRNA(Asn)/glutamyl-tRNA(Gln) amidotransferase subunit A